jgi:hypothetical protein
MKNTSQLFLVGHERSGTSLVRAVLESHPEFHIAPNDADPLLLLERFSRKGLFSGECIDQLSNDAKLSVWGIDWDGVKAAMAGKRQPCEDVYKIILEQFWKTKQTRWKAIKRPKYERRIDLLKRLFPECKIIALIRDPRAVLSSKKYYGGTVGKNWKIFSVFHLRLVTSMLRWQSSVSRIRKAEKVYGMNSVLVVRYEEIVNNPSAFLEQLFGFLGERYCEEEIFNGIQHSFNSNSTFLDESTETSVFRKDGLQRWKQKLEPAEQEIIHYSLRSVMVSEGYAADPTPMSGGHQMVCKINRLMMRLLVLTGRY